MKAFIRLFKAIPIKSRRKKKANKSLLEHTIRKGFIFSPEIIYNYSEKELIKLIVIIDKEIGLTSEQMNSSFHKSWKKVKEADIEQLVVEQLAHYMTTYGKESPILYTAEKEIQWGVDDLGRKITDLEDFETEKIYYKDYVYIPKEALDIPEIDIDNIKLTVIKGHTKKELKEKLLKLLQSGIALGEDTINDVIDVASFVKLKEIEIESIKNKEVKVILYDKLGLVPKNNVEFLRFLVYKATGKTLLIKSPEVIEEIKESKKTGLIKLFDEYKKEYGLEKLAEIFHRFKPLFLVFKKGKKLNKIINRIRKLAKKYHKPMKEDYLNSVTAKIQNRRDIYQKKLKEELSKVNTFRKIRLAYALKYRTKDVESILYRIRNGKGYATDFGFTQKTTAKRVLDVVVNSIVEDIKKNVKGKEIYIPEYITYTLPATEKQFTGDFPSGTYISIPRDMIVGIHWENQDNHRIDLDLSVLSSTTGKIGWDASYRTEDKSILFSGDVTTASKPRGASELFYVRRQKMDSFILFVNYYNYDSDVEVPFKIIVAKEQVSNFKNNYMIDPNKVMCIAKTKINQKQKILGLLVTTTNECRFYFAETYLGMSITLSDSDFVENSRKYLFNFYRNTISLNEILEKAGANIVTDKEKVVDINLSPENLEKNMIIELMTGGRK